MKEIKYITYYNLFDSKVRRNYALSSVNKVNYIIDTIVENNVLVKIISASGVIEPKFKFYLGEKIKMDNNRELKLFFSIGGLSILSKFLRRILIEIQIFFYLVFNIKRGEEIIVYHSLGYVNAIYLAKKIRKFILILEVEEIYQDVKPQKFLKNLEIRLIRIADKYIFPTQLLDEKYNKDGKPSIIIHGIYKTERMFNDHFNDKKIHIVYAGTFDPHKGGMMAAAAAMYLNENYHIHIIGFGSEKEVDKLKELILDISSRGKAKLTYDGLLKGDEYYKFIQKCDIGLSTQNPNAKFNDTSFPSKILSYLANGLCVISIRIKAVEISDVGKHIYYYNEQDPKIIAEKIKEVSLNLSKGSSINILKDLDEKFKYSINLFLSK